MKKSKSENSVLFDFLIDNKKIANYNLKFKKILNLLFYKVSKNIRLACLSLKNVVF